MLFENGILAVLHLLGDSLINVEEVTSTLVAGASESLLHYLIFGGDAHSMVIEFPPDVHGTVEKIGIVMADICDSVMDHDSMQVVWPFLGLGVWLLESILKAFDLGLKLRALLLSFIFQHG